MITAAIFDLDGTLVDSEPAYWDAWRTALGADGPRLEDQDFMRVMGMRPIEAAAHFIDFLQVPAVEPDKAAGQLADRMIAVMLDRIDRLQPMPGALHAVALARDAGLRTIVATAAVPALAEAALSAIGLRKMFEGVVSAESEPYGKPHPGVFLRAAETLGVGPKNCVVIEDSGNGVLAAKAARMWCVAVPERASSEHPFVQIADVKLSTLEHLSASDLTRK